MQRFLRVSHRYLGIAISLIFVLWFASGFAIIYTGGMPTLSESERLSHQPALELARVQITPQQARQISNSDTVPTLLMIMDRPAYQFSGRRFAAVFADDGVILTSDMIGSRQIAAAFTGVDENSIERIGRIEEVDQWTISLRGELPLEKFRLNDDEETEVYVSPRRGQVVLYTSSKDRLLAWLGAIPHWLYFVELRSNASLWSSVVIWLASLGSVLAVMGLILIFTQFQKVRPFKMARAIPYQGLMRWHYICGLLFGLITFTWVFSGLLSMEPYAWTNARGLSISRDVMSGGNIELQNFSGLNNNQDQLLLQKLAGATAIKEIDFKRIQGDHYYQLTITSDDSNWGFEKLLVSAADLQPRQRLFPVDYMVRQLTDAAPEFQLVAEDVLDEYDNYYYSRPSGNGPVAPLPSLRVKFNDPAETWYYLDLNTSELVYQSHRWGRVQRWLYNGLHSLDFGFFYASRPLWDIVVIVLLAGGLLLCALGCFMGFRRVIGNAQQMFRKP